jgi:hypothetical protein|tara:strand:- start:95 stop:1030 length:936 start_codon:yes stop_codon:yes gene_type:complete
MFQYIKQRIKSFLSSIVSKANDRNIFAIGSAHFSEVRQYYPNIKNLSDADYKVFSQTGEDGIIDYLLYSLNIKIPKFVEIGVGDYSESNTRYIFEKNCCKGMIIDKNHNLKNKVSKVVKLWRGDLTIVETKVTSKNIADILFSNNFASNVDILSLDIDGIDYWIIDTLPEEFSKVVVVEYNSIFGSNLEVTIPNIDNFDRKKYHYSYLCYGASLKALVKLMKRKKYVFVGTNIACHNAFFVLESEVKKLNLTLPDTNNLTKYSTSHLSDSRSIDEKLSYLSGKQKLKEIEDCEVIDLSDKENKLVKIKNIL